VLRDESDHLMITEQTYPIYSSESSQEKTKTSPSHSYQDQRQQGRNTGGRWPQSIKDDQYLKRSEQFIADSQEIIWRPGMTCQAIYWEDEQVWLLF